MTSKHVWLLLRVWNSDGELESALVKLYSGKTAALCLQRMHMHEQLRLLDSELDATRYRDSRVWHYAALPPWLDLDDPWQDSPVLRVPEPPAGTTFDDDVQVESEAMEVYVDPSNDSCCVRWCAEVVNSGQEFYTAGITQALLEEIQAWQEADDATEKKAG